MSGEQSADPEESPCCKGKSVCFVTSTALKNSVVDSIPEPLENLQPFLYNRERGYGEVAETYRKCVRDYRNCRSFVSRNNAHAVTFFDAFLPRARMTEFETVRQRRDRERTCSLGVKESSVCCILEQEFDMHNVRGDVDLLDAWADERAPLFAVFTVEKEVLGTDVFPHNNYSFRGVSENCANDGGKLRCICRGLPMPFIWEAEEEAPTEGLLSRPKAIVKNFVSETEAVALRVQKYDLSISDENEIVNAVEECWGSSYSETERSSILSETLLGPHCVDLSSTAAVSTSWSILDGDANSKEE